LQTDVEAWDSGLPKQELEANEFAGELLVPTRLLTNVLSNGKPCFDLIESLAQKFSTSLTATAYRFVEVTGHACALVWSERGTAKWFVRSEEFGQWIRLRERLDARTLSADCFGSEMALSTQESVPASAWLEGTLPEDARILEQTRCMPSYSGALTLLWIPEPFLPATRGSDDELAVLDPEDFGLRRKKWPGKR
jgi:hypothetical protein